MRAWKDLAGRLGVPVADDDPLAQEQLQAAKRAELAKVAAEFGFDDG